MVVVVETVGRGAVVVVCSVVVVRVTGAGGSAQPASAAMPTSNARPSAWREREGVDFIIGLQEIRASDSVGSNWAYGARGSARCASGPAARAGSRR